MLFAKIPYFRLQGIVFLPINQSWGRGKARALLVLIYTLNGWDMDFCKITKKLDL